VPIVRDATPYDVESIGEAHAEAWRIGYDELFPQACWKLRWISAVACGSLSSEIQHSVERC
jgi:hypothetical protein